MASIRDFVARAASVPRWAYPSAARAGTGAQRYGAAVLFTAVALAFALAGDALLGPEGYLLFAAAVALSAWYGGRGPGLLASVLSVLGIDYSLLPPIGAVELTNPKQVIHVAVFLAVSFLISTTTEALRRARADAELRAVQLEQANSALEKQMEEVRTLSEELQETNDHLLESRAEAERLAERATRLQVLTAALSEARTVAEVTRVVLDRGLDAGEASRGVLAELAPDGKRLRVLGARGDEPGAAAPPPAEIPLDADEVLAAAVRSGSPVWQQGTGAALPLVRHGELVGGLSLGFPKPAALGAGDRAFTLLLAQAVADALHRARSFDQEREGRREAETLARAREEVLGVVAHDLRNPLNLIGTATQFVEEVDPPPERRKEMLAMTRRAVQQMNRLIGDLLDTVRLQAGKLSLEVEEVPVRTLVAQAEETFRQPAAAQGIALEVVAPADERLAVRADPGRTLQVLGNLLANALKFTGKGGRVTLRVTPDEAGQVLFQVADTGPGIPPEGLAHLFDRFWQARKADRRGVGLGLAISKGIVEAHGGRIRAESAVGVGSTFSFTLPVGGRQQRVLSGQ